MNIEITRVEKVEDKFIELREYLIKKTGAPKTIPIVIDDDLDADWKTKLNGAGTRFDKCECQCGISLSCGGGGGG